MKNLITSRIASVLAVLAFALALPTAFAPTADAAGEQQLTALQAQASAKALAVTYPYADENGDGANDYTLEVGQLSNNYAFSYERPDSVDGPQDGVQTANFTVAQSKYYYYRVSNPQNPDAVTYSGYEYTSTDRAVAVTREDMHEGAPFDKSTVMRDFSLNSADAGDLYLNVGSTGHLKLAKGDSFSLYPMRSWLPIGPTGNERMIQPDYHVSVIDVDGTGAVTATEQLTSNSSKHKWVLRAVNPGVALVKVTYDALSFKDAMYGDDFSAIWPENTGLFVVSVDSSSDVEMGAYANRGLNGEEKLAGDAWDAELDTLYYFDDVGASYTLYPESGSSVDVARGSVAGGQLEIGAFTQDGVRDNGDGSFTVSGLVQGKHVLRVSKGANVSYQVVRARHADWTLYGGSSADAAHLVATSQSDTVFAYTDGTTPITRAAYEALDESARAAYVALSTPGGKMTLVFDTLYHPAGKLSGVYNMGAYIALQTADGVLGEQPVESLYGGYSQYEFASTTSCQTITFTVPEQASDALEMHVSVKAVGYGSDYGAHREVTYEDGMPANNNAVVKTAYFAASEPIVVELGEATAEDEETVRAREAARAFEAMVADIGEVTLDDADLIAAAQSALGLLSPAARAFVSAEAIEQLEQAVEQIEAMKDAMFTPVSIADGAVRVVIENQTWSASEGAPWDGVLLDTQVDIMSTDSILDLVNRALEDGGMLASGGTDEYIRSIEGITEKDNGPSSGWMCTLNGWFIDRSVNVFTMVNPDGVRVLRAGDEIRMLYSCDGGPDVGSTPNRNTKQLKRLAVSAGTLTPAFDAGTSEYTLEVPAGTQSVSLLPVAKNQNWQVRMFADGQQDDYEWYRLNDAIPVADGTVIDVVVGDPSWPSMNTAASAAQVYKVTVRVADGGGDEPADNAWDGETLSEPEQAAGTYQIATGAELAWFADQVNSGTGASYNAVLVSDIDLGDKPWTPIGSSTTKKYSGSFNGQGHTVSGLSCHITQWAPAGLFGIVSNATIKGVVVDGSVSAGDFYAAGGIAARMEGASRISECGNLAQVENKSTGRAGGIVGWSYGAGNVTSCYNRGSVSGNSKVAGIVADSEIGTSVANCYNAGSISGVQAYGVTFASDVSKCYNVGDVRGSSKTYIAYTSSSRSEVYYLEGCVEGEPADADSAVSLTAADLKAPSFVTTLGTAWQVDVGAAVNNGFPLLAWEQAADAAGIELEAPSDLAWLSPESADYEDFDITYEFIQATWKPVAGASGYKVKLFREGDLSQPLFESDAVEDTVYDFFDVFANLGATDLARYVFTVTALGDGEYYLDSAESAPNAQGFTFDGAAFVPAPAQLQWNEASKIAVWSRVPDADFYLVSLWRGATLLNEYELDKDILGTGSGNLSMRFLSNMTGSGDYFFTVRAGKVVASGPNEGKRAASALAVSSSTHYDAPEGETVEIASADDWMRIVNTTHEGTQYATDADAQQVEWAKNYVITADLDFSNLTAEQQVQTKAWGNIDAPFNGTLDGQGHKIAGLTLSNGDNGLFTYIGKNGEVKNLTVESANVLFNDNAGIFCQYNYGTISNCGVTNTNISSDYSGIIAGFLARNFGLVQDCYVEGGTIASTSDSSNGHAGFVGNNSGTIRRCWTSMDVSTGSYCAGGFCGWADERYNSEAGVSYGGVFENCFALGAVDAGQGWSGGFVGRVNTSRAIFKNCYAAGRVTSSQNPEHAHGFFGSMGGEGPRALFGDTASGFYITLPAENCTNCFYCSDNTAQDNPANLAVGKTLAEMQTDEFATTLGLDWERDADQNNGLPYLADMAVPQPADTYPITVQLAVALYDTGEYEFALEGDVVDVTFETAGNPRVIDVMQAAAAQGLIEYDYTVTPAYGSFISAINGRELKSPDGWMFTVDDDLSDVGVQLATVHDGAQLLWYQGMPANQFTPPAWQDVTGQAPAVEWIDISRADDLVALTRADADMSASYRLAADIDLAGIDFAGIGSVERPFAGVFKGKGKTISNLTINRPADHNVGLFNFVRGAEITGVTVRDADVTGDYSVGVLVGVADVLLDGSNRANCIGNLIGNCTVSGKVTSANADTGGTSNGAYVGGLVGFNNGDADTKTGISVASSIDRCQANVEVHATAMYAGGLVGGNYGSVTNCTAQGDVLGGDCTGGLFGGNVGTVYDSGATGQVTGGNRTGGFGGDNYNDAVERCYSTGDVRASGEHIGGFIGDAGGTVKDCASAGGVSAAAGSGYVGGFIGSYTGSLAGLYVRITFMDNYGWSAQAEGADALPALGNKKTSTVEAEQAVLDATRATDWDALRDVFAKRYGVVLSETAPVVEVYDDGQGGGEGTDEPGGDTPGGGEGTGESGGKTPDAGSGSGVDGKEPAADPAAASLNAITPTAKAADAAKATSKLAKPNAKKFTTKISVKGKKLTAKFKKVKGAVNYRIAYRKAGAKKWSYAWSAGKLSYTAKKLKARGMYQYRIAAYGKKGGVWVRSAWSKVTYCWLATTTVKLKAVKSGAKATLKRVSKASGYKLSWSAKKSMAKAKTKKLSGAKKTKAKITKLKRGKKTYVQATPYRKYRGHVYWGAASAKRAVKAK